MGLIQPFQNDVFISYAHADDMRGAAGTDRPGWVGALARSLRTHLRSSLKQHIQRLGELELYWDYQLRNDVPFSDELQRQVENSATFVVMMSQNYLESPWCKQECSWFLDTIRERTDRFSVQGSAGLWPLIVVRVGPTDENLWPQIFRQAIGYRFYHDDRRTEDPRFAYPSLDVNPEQACFRELNKLATALTYKFKSACELPQTSPAQLPPVRGARSLLLLPTEDLQHKVNEIETALSDINVRVARFDHSDKSLTSQNSASGLSRIKDFEAVVLLLGFYPGAHAGKDRAALIREALALQRDTGARLFVWVKPGLQPQLIDDNDDYRAVLETLLQNTADDAPKFSLFIDDLKANFQAQLAPESDEPRVVLVYLYADHIDSGIADQLRQQIPAGENADIEVICMSQHQMNDQSQQHQDLVNDLQMCDGTIIVNGHTPRQSVVGKLIEVRKISARRRQKGRREIRVAIYDAPPPPMLDVSAAQTTVINAYGESRVDELKTFIDELATD